MKKPTDTTRETQSNPLDFLAAAMVMGSSNAIERQEAQGQHELVNSEALPYRGSNGETRQILESWGFKFGDYDGKDLFIEVEMPQGWKKAATDHSMWSKLLDDRGRERASIFYKAAFYDRDAFMILTPRFSVHKRYSDDGVAIGVEVKDGVAVLHEIPFPTSLGFDASREERLAQAVAWLVEHFPDYQNVAAYWE